MRYSVYILLAILLSCKQQNNKINASDIIEIISINNKDIFNITNNFYIIDERYKNPGKYSLMLKNTEIHLIKETLIDNEIYKLNDSIKFIKSCENSACLSEITIKYKSGRKQHFIFDNHNYRDNFNNKSYRKITNLEEIISKIIMSKKIDPELVNIYL